MSQIGIQITWGSHQSIIDLCMMRKPKAKIIMRRMYLSNLRCERDMSQGDVSKLIGTETFVYCQMESGKRGLLMTAKKLKLLADAFKIPVERMVDLEIKYSDDLERLRTSDLDPEALKRMHATVVTTIR